MGVVIENPLQQKNQALCKLENSKVSSSHKNGGNLNLIFCLILLLCVVSLFSLRGFVVIEQRGSPGPSVAHFVCFVQSLCHFQPKNKRQEEYTVVQTGRKEKILNLFPKLQLYFLSR